MYRVLDSNLKVLILGPPGTLLIPSLFFFFKIFSLMWTIFKVFIEFVTILLLFYVLVFWPQKRVGS